MSKTDPTKLIIKRKKHHNDYNTQLTMSSSNINGKATYIAKQLIKQDLNKSEAKLNDKPAGLMKPNCIWLSIIFTLRRLK